MTKGLCVSLQKVKYRNAEKKDPSNVVQMMHEKAHFVTPLQIFFYILQSGVWDLLD